MSERPTPESVSVSAPDGSELPSNVHRIEDHPEYDSAFESAEVKSIRRLEAEVASLQAKTDQILEELRLLRAASTTRVEAAGPAPDGFTPVEDGDEDAAITEAPAPAPSATTPLSPTPRR